MLGGRENLPLLDICASNLGISSTVLLSKGGEAICLEQLDNVITGYATMIMTAIIVITLMALPTIYTYIKGLFSETPKKKGRVESNKSIVIIAKMLNATKARKSVAEREIWKIFEAENNCQNVKERVVKEYIAKQDSPQQLLLE